MNENASKTARALFQAGVDRADPYRAVVEGLAQIGDLRARTCIAVGKAAIKMMQAAIDTVGPFQTAIVVTNYENECELDGVTVYGAGHPVPDDNGAIASKAVIVALQGTDGPVLALISGGGSALLPAPKAPITLGDKAKVNEVLLASGGDIVQMNTIRQHLSDLKGGGMLRHAAPHPVTALILSDVVGDDLRAIASGPTVGPLASRAVAVALCHTLRIWDALPEAAKVVLRNRADENPLPDATNLLVGSNDLSLQAMAALDPSAHIFPKSLDGDVAAAAVCVTDFAQTKGIYLFGGETTVVIKGHGKGGRNQELALRVALRAEAAGWQNWYYLQGGTDGRDGPTDAAGGIVDATTLIRARAAGVDVQACLDNNDSYRVLKAADALLMTDATGTNVADLGVLIRG
jgi:glycerate 2-kinase